MGGYSCDTMLTSPVDNTAMGRVGVCLVGGPGANKKSCGWDCMPGCLKLNPWPVLTEVGWTVVDKGWLCVCFWVVSQKMHGGQEKWKWGWHNGGWLGGQKHNGADRVNSKLWWTEIKWGWQGELKTMVDRNKMRLTGWTQNYGGQK